MNLALAFFSRERDQDKNGETLDFFHFICCRVGGNQRAAARKVKKVTFFSFLSFLYCTPLASEQDKLQSTCHGIFLGTKNSGERGGGAKVLCSPFTTAGLEGAL